MTTKETIRMQKFLLHKQEMIEFDAESEARASCFEPAEEGPERVKLRRVQRFNRTQAAAFRKDLDLSAAPTESQEIPEQGIRSAVVVGVLPKRVLEQIQRQKEQARKK